jgi:capsular polysaccharide transport system ATP-binding protein
MLTGMTHPSSGRIIPKVKVSFPVGHLPGYDRVMTIAKNVEHIGHLYGMDVGPFVAFVRSTLKIGAKFDGYYPALTRDERRALAYVVAFSIPFDIYVLTTDKIRAAYKCMNLFKARRHSAGMIIPISAVAFAEEHCDASMVLHNGELQIFETVAEGHRVHVAQKRVAKAGVPR